MATDSKNSLQQLMLFNQLRVEELIQSNKEPEEQVSELHAQMAKDAYTKAILNAGKARMRDAKSNLKSNPLTTTQATISGAQARAALTRLKASNDSLITLAARNLEQVDDDEAISMIEEFIELGAISLKDIT